MKENIKNRTLEELKKDLHKTGEPLFRATQIFQWIYQKGVSDFDVMNNLPKYFKAKLKERYLISNPELFKQFNSTDGTEKFLFKLKDGNFIETVIIGAKERQTLCLSTQVGCKFGCAFCASGLGGFTRNLDASEMLGQVLFPRHEKGIDISNYVFMGMGEPLDNAKNLLKTILIMNEPRGLGIAARRITVSTCGIIPAIALLKDLKPQINLSISLHAANNKLRNELVPINRRYPLEKLIKACKEYVDGKGRLIMLEYVLIKDKNDSIKDADELAGIAKILRAKINLIPYSIVEGLRFKTPDKSRVDLFREALRKKRVNATVRQSKGKDIKAACGQLAGRR